MGVTDRDWSHAPFRDLTTWPLAYIFQFSVLGNVLLPHKKKKEIANLPEFSSWFKLAYDGKSWAYIINAITQRRTRLVFNFGGVRISNIILRLVMSIINNATSLQIIFALPNKNRRSNNYIYLFRGNLMMIMRADIFSFFIE